jgi:hypothetical protein
MIFDEQNDRSQDLARTLANDAAHWIMVWNTLRSEDGTYPPFEAKQSEEEPLAPWHILWMAEQVGANAKTWPPSRSHCWIGYIHAGMILHSISDLKQLRDSVRAIRSHYAQGNDE